MTSAISLLVLALSGAPSGGYTVAENDQQINIETPQLAAAVRKQGYTSGVYRQSFLDKKTGFRDPGFGLDIVDWLMEPGTDEAYRDRLPKELLYRTGDLFHGNRSTVDIGTVNQVSGSRDGLRRRGRRSIAGR